MLRKHDGVVVCLVLRGVDERDRPLAQALHDRIDRRIRLQLGDVARPEIVPLFGVVAERFPQFRAGRGLLQPQIDGGLLLCDSARPQPVDKNPEAVLRIWRFVHPFQQQRHALPSPQVS